MKDNISIIFATIILTFLIVLMPLYSILDRQDSMSYNLVLSETTKFVDEVRSNGFLTKDSYTNYIDTLSATGNTYKVVIEAYRKTLIPDGKNTYKEVRELYNTKDIEEIIYGEVADLEQKESNKRDNIFLFDLNDEFYVHVYNTNTTAGTIMYNMLLTSVDNKVIDITYGGMVNNINWELYTKLKSETIVHPSVSLSIPTNLEGKINIMQLASKESLADIKCATITNLSDLFAGAHELCTDVIKGETYKYKYDLGEKNDKGEYVNKTIKIVAKLSDTDMIDVSTSKDTTNYVEIDKVYSDSLLVNNKNVKKAIIDKYIRLNGMKATISITDFKPVGDYYHMEIKLTNVERESTANISVITSISILPGLGKDKIHRLTLGTESVKFEITVESEEKEALIIGPYNWKKFMKTNMLEDSLMDYIFANEEIFYKIQYGKVNTLTPEQILKEIKEKIKFTYVIKTGGIETEVSKEELINNYNISYYTEEDLKNLGYIIEENTIIIKFTYPNIANDRYDHRISLPSGWIDGVKAIETEKATVYSDTGNPNKPVIYFGGTVGKNNWYLSDVNINAYSSGDTGIKGGSGVYRQMISVSGATTVNETDADNSIKITNNGTHIVKLFSEDYVGNKSYVSTYDLNIDKELPTSPKITVSGTLAPTGWYTSKVNLTVVSGNDTVSGVDKTTYKIDEQTNTYNVVETSIGKSKQRTITLEESGIYKITVTTYDIAGNKSTVTTDIKVDLGEPPNANIEVIGGLKHSDTNEWYYTDVKARIQVNLTLLNITHYDESKYKLIKDGVVVSEGTFKGNVKDIEIIESGIYTLEAHTFTVSKPTTNPKITTYIIKIDKEEPNSPNVNIIGTKGTMEWYTSNVELNLVDTDENVIYNYIIDNITTGSSTDEAVIEKDKPITIQKDGEYTINVIARDLAGNETIFVKDIKIDKTAPTATLAIDGRSGLDELIVESGKTYYNSIVTVGYENATDNMSGISRVEINGETISTDYNGTVGIIIYDNAGNTTEYSKNIVVDMTKPSGGSVSVSGTASGQITTGVNKYSSSVAVTLKPATDTNFYQVNYSVTLAGTTIKNETVNNTNNIEFNLTDNGFYSIILETVDKAGNKDIQTKVIYIEK